MTAFDLVAPELERLPGARPKSIFGSKGYAIGNSVFAFVHDEEELVVKTDKYPTVELLPKGLTHFWAGDALMKSWVCIPITDDLREVRRYWHLVEESFNHAMVRDQLKKKRGK
ncbi:MAG TPA: hypothetical protein VFH43_04160 [Candidatus Kapabacteria bacterium]|nr:hypothetical protein [Candidatus Kapabacteria bacterium]